MSSVCTASVHFNDSQGVQRLNTMGFNLQPAPWTWEFKNTEQNSVGRETKLQLFVSLKNKGYIEIKENIFTPKQCKLTSARSILVQTTWNKNHLKTKFFCVVDAQTRAWSKNHKKGSHAIMQKPTASAKKRDERKRERERKHSSRSSDPEAGLCFAVSLAAFRFPSTLPGNCWSSKKLLGRQDIPRLPLCHLVEHLLILD